MKHFARTLIACLVILFAALGAIGATGAPASAAPSPSAAASATPSSFAAFTDGKTSQQGLFTVWRDKDGGAFLELAPDQLGKDFIIAGQPINGVGGFSGISQGNYYFLPATIIRFEKHDNKVAIVLPNTFFTATPGTPEWTSTQNSFARSVVSVAKIAATDDKTGDVVIDASPFLDDVIDLTDHLRSMDDPEMSYHLNRDAGYFWATKAFPKNVLLEVSQDWVTEKPGFIDTAPDARSIEVRVAYNIVEPPNDGYMPRLNDPRVGYFNQTVLDFSNDQRLSRHRRYIVRWNFRPADPNRPSVATNPMVFYLSNEIPLKYRAAVRRGLLTWNAAFNRVGILNAVQVRQQPDDPSWDPDDVRYSVVRWVSGSSGGGGAEAQLLWDPRTGEQFRTGITIDADLMREGNDDWQYFTNPRARESRGGMASFAAYGAAMRQQAQFGRVALNVMAAFGGATPARYNEDFLQSVVMHESGHDMGFQHNFIGSQAYTARELQDKAFTSRYGIVSSVMEYTPLNLWPRNAPQGAYFHTVLGPYDYYAIHWGYARVPGARTPDDEVPTLNRWASMWTNPWYRFASDEDAGGPDPRVQIFDLSNDSMRWCETQLSIDRGVLANLDAHFPWQGEAYDRERDAFETVFQNYLNCATYPQRYLIGGEYLSRSHRGDPHAQAPLTPVSRSEDYRAFSLMNRYLLAEDAIRLSPRTLNNLGYSEYTSLQNASWIYQPGRHDEPVAEAIAEASGFALSDIFDPTNLARIDEMALRTQPGQTMSLADLFDWMQTGVYGDLNSASLRSIPLLHRNLQRQYGHVLLRLAAAPPRGTPGDAQALARLKLNDLTNSIHAALARPLDEMTRAHLEALRVEIQHGLDARPVPGVIPTNPVAGSAERRR